MGCEYFAWLICCSPVSLYVCMSVGPTPWPSDASLRFSHQSCRAEPPSPLSTPTGHRSHLDFGFVNFANVAHCRIRHRIRVFTQVQPSLFAISGTCSAIVIMIIVVMIINFIDCAFLLTAIFSILLIFFGEFRHEQNFVNCVIRIAYVINFCFFFFFVWNWNRDNGFQDIANPIGEFTLQWIFFYKSSYACTTEPTEPSQICSIYVLYIYYIFLCLNSKKLDI